MAIWETIATAAQNGLGAIAGPIMEHNANIRERKWTEQMANSAHQREVKDLKAAGLNPILSATGGHGAPAPTSPTTEPFHDLMDKTVSSAIDALRLKKEIKLVDSQIESNTWGNRQAQENIRTQSTQNNLNYQLIKKEASNAKRAEIEAQAAKYTLGVVEKQARNNKSQLDIDYKLQGLDNTLKRLGQGTSAISNIMPGKISIGGGNKPTFDPKTTGTFNKKTGEIYDQN